MCLPCVARKVCERDAGYVVIDGHAVGAADLAPKMLVVAAALRIENSRRSLAEKGKVVGLRGTTARCGARRTVRTTRPGSVTRSEATTTAEE